MQDKINRKNLIKKSRRRINKMNRKTFVDHAAILIFSQKEWQKRLNTVMQKTAQAIHERWKEYCESRRND